MPRYAAEFDQPSPPSAVRKVSRFRAQGTTRDQPDIWTTLDFQQTRPESQGSRRGRSRRRTCCGTASGLFRTFGYIGSIASSAIIAIVSRTGVSDHGLHVIAVIMIAFSALALVIT